MAQNSGTQSVIKSIYAIDGNTVYAAGGEIYGGSGIILKTTNGGTNWNTIQETSQVLYWSVKFLDSNIGFVVGGSNAGFGSTILKTTNGGSTWNNTTDNEGNNLYAVQFPSTSVGYAVGFNGEILKTSNGGTDWIKIPGPTNNNLYAVYFTSTTNGFFAGDAGSIIKTTTGGITGINSITKNLPDDFKLFQNYPNPFNPSTIISFYVSNYSRVQLKVYDILGREVSNLINEFKPAGTYSITFDGNGLSSGIYLYRINSGTFSETKKMILVK